jgi:hypothetical protein
VTVTSRGIRMTLTVPGSVFPPEALVRFTVRVQNVSHHTVMTRLGPQCSDTNPAIEVLDAAGNVTDQWPPGFFPHPCPFPFPQPFAPGQSWTEHLLAVTNGVSVRAALLVWHQETLQASRVVTPAVSIQLVDGQAPNVTLSLGPFATIPRPVGAHGPLYAVDSTECAQGGGIERVDSNMLWYPVKGDRITSACSGTQRWVAWAGYVGYPVATIDYIGP